MQFAEPSQVSRGSMCSALAALGSDGLADIRTIPTELHIKPYPTLQVQSDPGPNLVFNLLELLCFLW